MGMTPEQRLLELYIANIDMIGTGFPIAFNAPRRNFIEAFNLMSLSGADGGRSIHRDIGALFEREWEYYFAPTASIEATSAIVEDGHLVAMRNGFCDPELNLRRTKEGAIYGSLREAAGRMDELFTKHYNSLADNLTEPTVALNSAFIQDGVFIYLPDGVTVDRPFVLSHIYETSDESQASFARVLVILGRGSRAEVVSEHRSVGGGSFLVNCVREVILADEAELEFTEVGSLNEQSSLLLNSYTRQSGGSRLKQTGFIASGLNNYVSGTVNLDGVGCRSEINKLYLASGRERCDINYVMNHNSPDCLSEQLIKGVVGGESVGSFTGRVYVAPDAQRTDAKQLSRNLQLSGQSRIFTEPQLEIYADDVKCTHGATVGQVEDDSIYYMRQRGLSEQQAKKLQMSGFVNDVLDRCSSERVCEKMRALAAQSIDRI